MEDKSFYMDILIGLLQAIAIEKRHIPVDQVPNFPAETYRAISETEVWNDQGVWLVCPKTRKEVYINADINQKKGILCPACKKNHLLADGKTHNMKELGELNMFDISW